MISSENKESVRKPHNILINPDALHKARVEALRERNSLGRWIKDAIKEKIEREETQIK